MLEGLVKSHNLKFKATDQDAAFDELGEIMCYLVTQDLTLRIF